ncbi:MAG TPA: four helix bundle protein [Candidatus Binatia bacterium]|nr:four helix bundle protein [Candidatus Binatia bacterium]
MQVKNFEDLEIWQTARHLAQEIYNCSRSPKFSEDFALRDPMQRAAVSVMSNIAEGFERGGNQEFVQFLYIAKGSCGEVRSQLYVALDQSYVTPKDCDDASKSFRRLSIMISNLIDYLKTSGMKGSKYTATNRPKNPGPLIRSETA